MMCAKVRAIYYILLIGLYLTPGKSQTFYADNGGHITGTVASQGVTEFYCYLHKIAPQDSLQLKWRRIHAASTPGWNAVICDYGLCYDSIPAFGTMQPAQPGAEPYLKLLIQNPGGEGECYAHFKVADVLYPTEYTDVFFAVATAGYTATNEAEATVQLIQWNASLHTLTCMNASSFPGQINIFDVTGRQVLYQTIPPFSQMPLVCHHLPPGNYFVTAGQKKLPLHIIIYP